jgi:CubicO group peptidase (beta-lactamase class C family)
MSSKKIIQNINKYLSEYNRIKPFSGSVLVAKDCTIMYKKSFGHASIEHNILNTPSTKYRIWSITKLFTATAVLMLHEIGQFDLDDPINKLLPEYPVLNKHITVRHLLTHTSGLVSYTESEEFNQKLNKLPLG